MKINQFEIENVKRVKAVRIEPAANGLTVIGGKNGQGKTSVLDAIVWALGGNKYRPSDPKRSDSVNNPSIRIVMNNGLIVERKGKNSDLKVTDPKGQKAGQQLLDSFVEELALNLSKFMNAPDKEKANTLLRIIGIGDQLAEMDLKEKQLYNERLTIGRIADQKKKYAAEQPFYKNVPDDLVSASDLIRQQQEILARNGQREYWIREYNGILNEMEILERKIKEYEQVLRKSREFLKELDNKRITAEKTPAELEMESTEELEASIANVEEINRKVRANLDRERAVEDAQHYQDQYNVLTAEIEAVRVDRQALLDDAELPLPGLGVRDGELTYLGQKWDNMSGSQQLIVSTAIVKELNPECRFVLLDKLEQMDLDTLEEFGEWLKQNDIQVIATRVSTGDECSVIIEDGMVANAGDDGPFIPKKWEGGF